MSTKSFNQWLPECEADLRNQSNHLFYKYRGWRLGIDSGDLFNQVVVKLAEHNYPVASRGKLFGLVSRVAITTMQDLGRSRGIREKYFSIPMATQGRPLPATSIETVPSNGPTPAEQLTVADELACITQAVAADPKLTAILKDISALCESGEPTTNKKIARLSGRSYKEVTKLREKLRNVAIKIRDDHPGS